MAIMILCVRYTPSGDVLNACIVSLPGGRID